MQANEKINLLLLLNSLLVLQLLLLL